jgi:hypothetical protein
VGRLAALTFRKVEDRLLELCLIGAVATSIILTAVGIDVKWFVPGIFLAQYGIFRILADMRETRAAGIESACYANSSEFYKAAQGRFQSAKNTAWVTYTRLTPPSELKSAESESYFRYTLNWARLHPDREFRRIIYAADSVAMAAWLTEHREDTKHISNYKAKVVKTYGPADEIGLAIFDGEMVMLALCSGEGPMTGHSIREPAAVHAFREYYIRQWENAETLEDCVSSRLYHGRLA